MVVGKGADEPNLDGGGTTVFVKGADGKLAVDDKKQAAAGGKHTPQYSAALSMKKGQMAPATDAARKAAEDAKNAKSADNKSKVEVSAGKKPPGHAIKVTGTKKDPNEIGSSGTSVNPKQAAAAVTAASAAPAVTTAQTAAPVKLDENFSQYYKTGRVCVMCHTPLHSTPLHSTPLHSTNSISSASLSSDLIACCVVVVFCDLL